MSSEIKIGLIGLDTSHAPSFTKLLNDTGNEFHVPGGRVVAAYPGGSPDFALSWDRVQGFTEGLRNEHGVEILDSPGAVAETCDAILLTSADGRVHLEQFRAIAPFGKSTFIDKPLATTSEDARQIVEVADHYKVPLMTTSSLRFAQPLVDALALGEVLTGVDCSGPMKIEPTQGGLFWYGIHSVEMLYAALGTGCTSVTAVATENHDLVTGVWSDGRIGTVRGNRTNNNTFGALLHGQSSIQFVDAVKHPKPVYAGLLENIMTLIRTGQSPVPLAESLEIIRFIEAANESRETGHSVSL